MTIWGKTFGGETLLSVVSVCPVGRDSFAKDIQAAFQSNADAVERKLSRFSAIQDIPRLLSTELCVRSREKPLFLCLNQEGIDKKDAGRAMLRVAEDCAAGEVIDAFDIQWDMQQRQQTAYIRESVFRSASPP